MNFWKTRAKAQVNMAISMSLTKGRAISAAIKSKTDISTNSSRIKKSGSLSNLCLASIKPLRLHHRQKRRFRMTRILKQLQAMGPWRMSKKMQQKTSMVTSMSRWKKLASTHRRCPSISKSTWIWCQGHLSSPVKERFEDKAQMYNQRPIFLISRARAWIPFKSKAQLGLLIAFSLSSLMKRSYWCSSRAESIGQLSGMSCETPSARTWSMPNASRTITTTSSISWGTTQHINSISRRQGVYSLHPRERRRWERLPTSVKNHAMIESLALHQVEEDSKSPQESIQGGPASHPICIRACTRARAKISWSPTQATSCLKASHFSCSTRKPKGVPSQKTKGWEETAPEIPMIHIGLSADLRSEASSLEIYFRMLLHNQATTLSIKQRRPKMIPPLPWHPRVMPRILVHKWISWLPAWSQLFHFLRQRFCRSCQPMRWKYCSQFVSRKFCSNGQGKMDSLPMHEWRSSSRMWMQSSVKRQVLRL